MKMKSAMKTLLAATVCALALSGTANAALYSGDVTGGGLFEGLVTRNDAWAQENPLNGDEMNFWTFSGVAGQVLSIGVTSLFNIDGDNLDAAVSIYRGALTSEFELLMPGFDNDGDFAGLSFLTGSPSWGTIGNDVALLDIVLPETGVYTIAVGGEGFLNFDDDYGYQMNVSAVPVPAAVWLFGSGLAGLLAMRRRRA
jgi:hypothetical protein